MQPKLVLIRRPLPYLIPSTHRYNTERTHPYDYRIESMLTIMSLGKQYLNSTLGNQLTQSEWYSKLLELNRGNTRMTPRLSNTLPNDRALNSALRYFTTETGLPLLAKQLSKPLRGPSHSFGALTA